MEITDKKYFELKESDIKTEWYSGTGCGRTE